MCYAIGPMQSASLLTLRGWTDIAALIAAAAKDGKQLDSSLIQAAVTTSDKKRFPVSEDGLRIRAVQGHSTESVAINYAAKVPPEFLYHGTATRFLDSIRKEGLLPGLRQYVRRGDQGGIDDGTFAHHQTLFGQVRVAGVEDLARDASASSK